MGKEELSEMYELMSRLNGLIHSTIRNLEAQIIDYDGWEDVNESMDIEAEIQKKIEELSKN